MHRTDLYHEVLNRTENAEGLPLFDGRHIALAILPGGGDPKSSNTRLSEVHWQKFTQKIWVAGTRGDPYYEEAQIRNLLAKDQQTPSSLLVQYWASHTVNQMRWITNCILADSKVLVLILSTAKYHLPRCVLTFIKVWMNEGDKRDLKIALLPTSDPQEITSNFTASSRTVEEELRRIGRYQQNGEIATEEEFFSFLNGNT